MQLPGLNQEEEREFLAEPLVAKVATHARDGELRISALWFEHTDDGRFRFNTFEQSEVVANLDRDPTAALLIDSTEQPYKAVHYRGRAEVDHTGSEPEDVAPMFAPYVGGQDEALEYVQGLHQAGKRVFVYFTPDDRISWDFSKSG